MNLERRPFSVSVDESTLDDLRARLTDTRLPVPSWDEPWSQGTDRDYLAALIEHWRTDFDWRAQERHLNSFDQFVADVDGTLIHFVHERAPGGGIPLVLTHGWPSAFTEFLELVPLLTRPGAHQIDGPAFDVVLPSLPGYGFSQRPQRRTAYRDVARLWHGLMQGLGYDQYGALGGDFGSGVSTFMALDSPERVLGLYLTDLEISPYSGDESRSLSDAEREYVEAGRRWASSESGYKAIQSTKPQTLGYALNDSPAGLAAWIVEKWRSWSDNAGDLEEGISRDFLLTLVTLYWVTETIVTSMRDYYDNRRWQGDDHVGPGDFVTVPTAVGVFSGHLVREGTPPREWAERLYDVHRWTPMPAGGHFPAVEEPELLARDVSRFFADIEDGPPREATS